MTVPGWDPIIQYGAALERIADLQESAARERLVDTTSRHDARGARSRIRLGIWLIRLGRAVAADREAVERALGRSAAGFGGSATRSPTGR